jgi:hypothetical protein
MQVRLKSEVGREIAPAAAKWSLFLMFAALGLAVYASIAWYFPKGASWWLAVPVGLLGIFPAMAMNRSIRESRHRRLAERAAPLVGLIFLPCAFAVGFGVGAPALVLRQLGPNTEVTTTVLGAERKPSKSCRHEVVVARYSNTSGAKFCVSPHEFDWFRKKQTVLIATRDSYLGTLAFSIRPADQGPE